MQVERRGSYEDCRQGRGIRSHPAVLISYPGFSWGCSRAEMAKAGSPDPAFAVITKAHQKGSALSPEIEDLPLLHLLG
jgi:hypothetical protein